MKYFVVSDIHGYYTILKEALDKAGFDENNSDHILISCGDIFDRGDEPYEMYQYLKHLKEINKVVLVKGNHEDLMNIMLENEYPLKRDYHNKTYDTVYQLLDSLGYSLETPFDEACRIIKQTDIPAFLADMVNYYVLDDYIFCHGYLPMNEEQTEFIEDSDQVDWFHTRWIHGYEKAKEGIYIKGKTIVCGHVGCDVYREEMNLEYKEEELYSPLYTEGCISIDAHTYYSKKINVLVIEK